MNLQYWIVAFCNAVVFLFFSLMKLSGSKNLNLFYGL